MRTIILFSVCLILYLIFRDNLMFGKIITFSIYLIFWVFLIFLIAKNVLFVSKKREKGGDMCEWLIIIIIGLIIIGLAVQVVRLPWDIWSHL